jgi:hypothetical protein
MKIKNTALFLLLGSSIALAQDANYQSLQQAQRSLATSVRETAMAVKVQYAIPRWNDDLQQKAYLHCAGKTEEIKDADQRQQWLIAHPEVEKCMVQYIGEMTGVLAELLNEVKAGKVSGETVAKARSLAELPNSAIVGKLDTPIPIVVDPWGGSNAKIEHVASGVFLTYIDNGGTTHRYAVMRPKFMPAAMFKDDTGGWIYVTPDRKSGKTFTMSAGGDVTSATLTPMQIPMAVGQ